MSSVQITLIGKPGCHLCDDARAVIEASRAALSGRGIVTELRELDILQDEALARQHSEDIPVVMIGEKRHAIWRVDAARFESAVVKAAKPSLFSRIIR